MRETSNVETLEMRLSSIECDDSQKIGEVPLIESLKTETMKEEEIENQRKQIKELKSPVTNLMTQLSRMADTDKELEDTKSELKSVKRILAIEQSKAKKYRAPIIKAKRILAPEAEVTGKETSDSMEKRSNDASQHVKSVRFNENVETKVI